MTESTRVVQFEMPGDGAMRVEFVELVFGSGRYFAFEGNGLALAGVLVAPVDLCSMLLQNHLNFKGPINGAVKIKRAIVAPGEMLPRFAPKADCHQRREYKERENQTCTGSIAHKPLLGSLCATAAL